MAAESEDVLGIEHQQIQLEAHHPVDEAFESFESGDLSPRDIEEKPSTREVRRVLDLARGEIRKELRQGLDGVSEPRLALALGAHEIAGDGEAVCVGIASPAEELDARAEVLAPSMGLDWGDEPRTIAKRRLKRLRGEEIALPRSLGKDDGDVSFQAEGASTRYEGSRRREKRNCRHGEDSNNLAPLATVEYARVLLMSGTDVSLWPAAIEAAEMIDPGMVVGLGTGRAAAMFVRALAGRIREGLRARGVPTSKRTEELANELGVPLVGLDEIEIIDIDVDGADEVDPSLDLIKGHGGALLRERVVASISKKLVILAGEEKIVPRLGARMAVPVEVVPFAAPVTKRKIETLGAVVHLRTSDGRPFVSDNGNQILDAKFESIEDGATLERRINAFPGVVDNGLFIGMTDVVLVQSESGFRQLSRS